MTIHGHSGGNLVDSELLDYQEIPLGWKEYILHVGGSFTMHSIMQAGLRAGAKDTKEGRQTVFFTALDPIGDELDEEYDDLSKPRKVHYQSKWTITQDAIYCVNLRYAQDKGLTFWQTRPRVIILYDSVPDERIEKMVSTRQGKILYQRIPTPRPPPNIVLKDAWEVQQDQEVQQASGEKSTAGQEYPFKLDFRVQGVP